MASLAEFLQAQKQFQDQPTALDYYADISKASMIPTEINLKNLEARQKFEDYENTQKLRKLFAESAGMPDIAQVGQYSPEMAIKLQQAQLENLVKQAQIRSSEAQTGKTGLDMERMKKEMFANTLGPYGDEYYMDIQSGMPQEQALNKFRYGIAKGLNDLQAQGLNPDAAFDMENLMPDQIIGRAEALGYKSRAMQSRQKVEEERQIRQIPPAPTPAQLYGDVHMTPQGPMRVPPVVGGGQAPFAVVEPSEMKGMQQAPIGAEDVAVLRDMYQRATGPQKEQLGRMLADAIKAQIPNRNAPPAASGGFITPQQRQKMVTEEEAAKTEASETAKAKVAQAETRKQKADVLSSLPKVPELNDLIDKSISGQIETIGKGKILGEMAGIPSEALDATKQLEIVAAQMKQITKSLVGAGAVSDFEQRQMAEAAGNIADPRTPAKTRKLQLGMFNRILRKSLNKSPELAKGLNEPQENDADASYNEPDEDERVDAALRKYGIK